MSNRPVSTGAPLRSRRAKRLRRLAAAAAAAAAYLLCWAVTWAFAPAASNRWWERHYGPTGLVAATVEFRTDVSFAGRGLEFWSSPIPLTGR